MCMLLVHLLILHVNYTLYILYMQQFDNYIIGVLKSYEYKAQNILNSLKAFVQVH